MTLFRRRTEKKTEVDLLDPTEIPEPTELAGYLRRAWAFHSRGKNDQAEADLRRAISIEPTSVDANYVMGLVQKAQGHPEAAIAAFQRVIELLEQGYLQDKARSEMLRRLSIGHVNMLTQGDWNLEDHIWRRV